jgi:membrane-bound lytic murein transglycosylase A
MIHPIRAPFAFALAMLVALAACTSAPPPPGRVTYVKAAWSELPGFADDRVSEAWPALVAGCTALAQRPASAAIWREPCAAAANVDGRDERAVRTFLAAHFSPYRIGAPDGADRGLVTGYYEAKLEGSRERTARFAVPLHMRPDDLLTVDIADVHPPLAGQRVRGRLHEGRVVSYWPRADIVRGRAGVEHKALVFVADPLDAFFLEVQGSGRVRLQDGTTLRLGYADQNGHAYRAIGRVLVERGEMKLEDVSLQSIRAWARAHPHALAELLDQNPSYVFFREIAAPAAGSIEAAIDGPIGALGVPLLARRTIAVDPAAVPLGAPVWLATTQPQRAGPLERLVFAQDTGGAIRGALRADFFWGFGDDAMERAGRMRESGRLWLLWPTGAPVPGTTTAP